MTNTLTTKAYFSRTSTRSSINEKLKLVLEGLSNVQHEVSEMQQATRNIPPLVDDLKIVKAAVTDQSRQVTDHELRLGRLETYHA